MITEDLQKCIDTLDDQWVEENIEYWLSVEPAYRDTEVLTALIREKQKRQLQEEGEEIG